MLESNRLFALPNFAIVELNNPIVATVTALARSVVRRNFLMTTQRRSVLVAVQVFASSNVAQANRLAVAKRSSGAARLAFRTENSPQTIGIINALLVLFCFVWFVVFQKKKEEEEEEEEEEEKQRKQVSVFF